MGDIFTAFQDLVNEVKDAEVLGSLKAILNLFNAKVIDEKALNTTLIGGYLPLSLPPGVSSLAGMTPSLFLKEPAAFTKWFTKQDSMTQLGIITKWKSMTGGKELIGILLRNAVALESKSWWMKALPWVAAAITVMGTTTFVEFLYEETLQTAGMGIYVAVANKEWDAAADALSKAWPLMEKAETIYKWFGWLAPYSWNVFKSYAEATRLQYNSYRAVIAAKGGIYVDPSGVKKVFNKDEFKENLTTGTAPTPTSLVAGLVVEEIPEKVVKEVVKPAVIEIKDWWEAEAIGRLGRGYYGKKVDDPGDVDFILDRAAVVWDKKTESSYYDAVKKGYDYWLEKIVKEVVKPVEKPAITREKELFKLLKAEQVDMLLKLGVAKKNIPQYEKDRVALIMSLEKGEITQAIQVQAQAGAVVKEIEKRVTVSVPKTDYAVYVETVPQGTSVIINGKKRTELTPNMYYLESSQARIEVMNPYGSWQEFGVSVKKGYVQGVRQHLKEPYLLEYIYHREIEPVTIPKIMAY